MPLNPSSVHFTTFRVLKCISHTVRGSARDLNRRRRMQVNGKNCPQPNCDGRNHPTNSSDSNEKEIEQAVNERLNRIANLFHEQLSLPLPTIFQIFRESAVPGDSPVNPHLCLGIIRHGSQKGTRCTQRPVDGCHGFCARHIKQHPRWNPVLGCVQLPQPPYRMYNRPRSMIYQMRTRQTGY